MSDRPDPAAIARGLSKAQRESAMRLAVAVLRSAAQKEREFSDYRRDVAKMNPDIAGLLLEDSLAHLSRADRLEFVADYLESGHDPA